MGGGEERHLHDRTAGLSTHYQHAKPGGQRMMWTLHLVNPEAAKANLPKQAVSYRHAAGHSLQLQYLADLPDNAPAGTLRLVSPRPKKG